MKTICRDRLLFFVAMIASAFLFFGCATQKINWDSRVGNYTFDHAVLEFGPPERSAKLSDGRTVGEWLLYRGRSGGSYYGSYHYRPGYGGFWPYRYHDPYPSFPDRYIRLTFSPEGRLENWQRVTK